MAGSSKARTEKAELAEALAARTSVAVLLWTLVPSFALIFAAAAQSQVPLGRLFRDAMLVSSVLSQVRPWYGIFSHLGIVLLVLAAGGGLVTLIRLRARRLRSVGGAFLGHGTAVTLVLALDDLLMIHEWANSLVSQGELYVIALYGLFVASFVLRFGAILRRREPALLAIVVAGLAVSLLVDVIVGSTESFWIFIEDGAKFVGYAAWFAYFLRACAAIDGEIVNDGGASR